MSYLAYKMVTDASAVQAKGAPAINKAHGKG